MDPSSVEALVRRAGMRATAAEVPGVSMGRSSRAPASWTEPRDAAMAKCMMSFRYVLAHFSTVSTFDEEEIIGTASRLAP